MGEWAGHYARKVRGRVHRRWGKSHMGPAWVTELHLGNQPLQLAVAGARGGMCRHTHWVPPVRLPRHPAPWLLHAGCGRG